ncbi:MAG: 5-formyltetrahydrofolate cyclo-ligase [Roseburia sp.]|nr:5-formyltetrahydrofolate cyclo-ligase [Roseburia sp.]
METSQGFPEQEAAAEHGQQEAAAEHGQQEAAAERRQQETEEERRQREAVRKRHIALRGAMTAEEVRQKSGMVCARLLASDWYEESGTIYGYYPLGKEVDPLPFLAQALLDGKTVALPVSEKADCRMEFRRITSLSQVAEGNFHVMEPEKTCPLIQAEDAVVIVPGVVFDRTGNRYGYGRGYYDRYFARFPGLRRMALAYENQMEARLDVFKTDVRMEHIYTEKTIY